MSDSPGPVDFAVGVVNSVLNLPEGQVKVFGKFRLQKKSNQCCLINVSLAQCNFCNRLR